MLAEELIAEPEATGGRAAPGLDPEPFARFIEARLLKPLPQPAISRRAIAETEIPTEGDDWFWTDDNAKILDFLSLPAVWRRRPDAVADVLDFVVGMCRGPLIFRRCAAPRFEVDQIDGGTGRFLHSFMNIWSDLSKGEVACGMRFHDGRTSENMTFGGNYVRFTFEGGAYTVDAEDGVFDTRIEPTPNGVRFEWSSHVDFQPQGAAGERVRAGRLTYSCETAANSMFLDFECAFAIEPGLELADVVLSFGCDRLSHDRNSVRYETLSVLDAAREPVRFRAEGDGAVEIPVSGAVYWSIAQTSSLSGFACAIHSLPRDPSRVSSIRAVCDGASRLHWVASEHAFSGRQAGRLVAQERKIITSGGFYDDLQLYADVLTRDAEATAAAGPVTDYSVSYDYGAEIYALARCLRSIDDPRVAARVPGVARRRRQIVETLDQLIDAYARYVLSPGDENASGIFSRSLSYVALTHALLISMGDRAGHAEALWRVCRLIAGFERVNLAVDGRLQSGFVMGVEHDALPYFDCHTTCLLALVRGCEALGSAAWLEAIDRGLTAFCLDTQRFEFCGDRIIDVVAVDYLAPDGVRRRLEGFWTYKIGLFLQLLSVLRASPSPHLQRLWAKHRDRLEILETVARTRLERSLRRHDDGIEILTSMLSSETNSETQPWAALGLLGETC